MPYIRHLYYEEAGAGRPVILIHCPAVSQLYWRPVVDRLSKSCRCLSVDLRGHGRSGLGDTPWSFPDLAADLDMLVRRLDLASNLPSPLDQKPVLVGFSTGGSVALQAVLDNPDLYSGLILVGSFSECSTVHLRTKIGLGLAATQAGMAALVGRSIASTNAVGPEHARLMMPEATHVRPASLACLLSESMRANFTPRLGEIRQPALLVYGEKDDPMHEYYRILRRGLCDARSVFVQHCDHRVPSRFPVAFADLVAEFLAQIEPDPSMMPLPSLQHPGIHTDLWGG